MNPQAPNYTPQKNSRLPLVVITLLLIIALIFGFWAFSQRQNYKNNSDKKSAAAVDVAKKQLTAQLQADFDKQAKNPYQTYQGSATYGTITFDYPKTWSGYDGASNSEALNLYFFPGIVPGTDSNISYPLRVELLDTDYAQTIDQFSGNTSDGSVKASTYIPPKMKGVTNVIAGTRFDGAIGQSGNNTQNGSMVIIKVRDKTLQISTETSAGVDDFNNIVLASLTFVP